VLVEDAVLAQRAVDAAAEAGLDGLEVEGAGEVALVEEGDDFGAGGEARYLRADGDDFAGAVGAGDGVVFSWEWVFAL
jgi:hypothetical protein